MRFMLATSLPNMASQAASTAGFRHLVRVLITQRLHGSIDGMQLDRFQPGLVYDVGPILGALFLAEQWAEPVEDDHQGVVTPVTSVRGFSDAKPMRGWQRRWMRNPDRALAADTSTRRSRKPSRPHNNKKGR
jgi:hypothetical protein